MKDHPIIFSDEMYQAILDSRKTQTRRIVKKVPKKLDLKELYEYSSSYIHSQCPYGQPGDLLWVRERTIEIEYRHYHDLKDEGKNPGLFLYKNDISPFAYNVLQLKYGYDNWKSPIHMQKDAARIWLQITDIRVERLQDISDEDAIAEGILKVGTHRYKNYLKDLNDEYFLSPLTSFRSLFESVNGEQVWYQNPWVWVISFKVLSTNGKPQI
jgi:hypothetical protein